MDLTEGPQIVEFTTNSLNYTPYSARWIPASARFVVAGAYPKGTGVIQVYEVEFADGKSKVVSESDKTAGIRCSTFGASLFEKRHLATGDMKGNLNIWDLEKMQTPVFAAKAHDDIIHTIDGCGGLNIGGGAPEIVTGGRDGRVRIWDPRQKTPVAAVEPAEGTKAPECWAVAFGNSFSDEERCVVSGYSNGDLKLLDLRTNKLRWEHNVKNGICGLEFDRKDIPMNKLVCTTLENRFTVFDMRTQHSELGFASLTQPAHKSTVWQVRHLPQFRDVFATCGGNGTLDIWKYNYPDQRVVKDEKGEEKGVAGSLQKLNSKKVAEQPIIGFDWNTDKSGLCVMCSLDQQVKVCVVTKLKF